MGEKVTAEKKLTGTQKAAIFSIAIGAKESAQIIKRLPEDMAGRLARAIATLDHVTNESVDASFAEYNQFFTSQRLLLRGGVDYAQKILIEAYGPEVAAKLISRLNKSLEIDLSIFDNFRKVDPQQLAKFVQDEHPQTIALILSHLDPLKPPA